MWDVFVSYKAEDRPRVAQLVDALEADGLSVWWDAKVEGGHAWRDSIAEHLDAARCVIVVWSKRSTAPEGHFVRDEASRAQQRQTYLPVTIDKVRPPLGFGEMQALPLTGWKGNPSDPRYAVVRSRVHAMLGRTAPPVEKAAPPSSVTRRVAIAGGTAAVVAAAGAGGWLLFRPAGAKANTVAVLPFANLSGDPSQNYFSDGMAEEVRSALATVGGLEVVARTSSEKLRNADAITAAKRLSVANVITGSVRRSPSTIRVSAQLVDGKSGLERWSQSFDRPMGDVLQIQSDIAANVARALSVALGSAAGRLSLGGTKNPQAQDVLLQSTALEGDDSSAGLLRRIALLEEATRLDSNYAEAYARKGLFQCIWGSTWAANDTEKTKYMSDALASAKQSIAIEPNLSVGFAALGLIYANLLQMKLALEALRRSVELPGAEVPAFTNYGIVLSRALRQGEGEAMMERATNLDPLNPQTWAVRSWTLLNGRRYSDGIEAARQALTIAPRHLRARTLLAWNLLFLGRIDEAQRELQSVPDDDYRRLVAEAAIAARSNRTKDALLALEPLQKRYANTAKYQEAEIYAQLGDKNAAIQALQDSWTLKDSGMAAIQVDPFLDPIRNDPRFPPLVKRVFG